MKTRVKICGVTRVRDARLAVSLGATMIGCVMAPDSKRRASLKEAAAIVEAVGSRVPVVLVFRSVPAAEAIAACAQTGAGTVQLHGAREATCELVEKAGLKVIRVRRVGGSARKLPRLLPKPGMHRLFLLDSGRGGTGKTFEWKLLGKRAPSHVFVAGGINPANVGAVMKMKPYGIDLAGGVESAPGIKDARLVRALFQTVGGAL